MAMSSEFVRIRAFMTPAPEVIESDLTLDQARARMFSLDARHLPVVERGALVGILSQRDIALIEAVGDEHGELTVAQAMHANPCVCGPDAHLTAVARTAPVRTAGRRMRQAKRGP